MIIFEFLMVVMWYICKGRKFVRENVCVILERFFLKEGFKEMMGVSLGVLEGFNSILLYEKYFKFVKLVIRILLVLCLL